MILFLKMSKQYYSVTEIVPGEKINLAKDEIEAYDEYVKECADGKCKPFYKDAYEYKTQCWSCEYYYTNIDVQKQAYKDYTKICDINGWEVKFDDLDTYILYQEYIKRRVWETEPFAEYKKKMDGYRQYIDSCNAHNWNVVFTTPEQYAAYIDYMANRNEGEKWGEYIKRKNIKL